MRILVVDNDFRSRWSFTEWLSLLPGIKAVKSAASTDDALAMLAFDPQVVIVDFHVPVIGAIAFTRAIKSRPKPPLVVVVTDELAPEYVNVAKRAGADLLLNKKQAREPLLSFLTECPSLSP